MKMYLPLVFLILLTTLTPSAIAADTTDPFTTYTMDPSSPDGNNNWYKSAVTFTLDATDLDTGVKQINYKIDSNPWQSVLFGSSLNLVTNPSFELSVVPEPGVESWEATTTDVNTAYSQETADYAPGFQNASAKIVTTGIGWHGINNKNNFAAASSYQNMSAAVSFKTSGVSGSTYFKIYAISQDALGNQTETLIGTSDSITGTNDWTRIYLNFIVNVDDAIGVYIDIGMDGTGTMLADAVSINSSSQSASTDFIVNSDNENHQIIFYSEDFAGNIEGYDCSSSPKVNCVEFKQDVTPPGNWHNSGAFRGILGPSDHHLYVYTQVDDLTSGLSTFTDRYQYMPDSESTFGIFSDLMQCSSTWQTDNWEILISPPFLPGVKSAYLLTPKTDFCNSNWKVCKTVRFYSEDMAGNYSTKDLCLNGPWIRIQGGGIVRANNNIDMLSEADNYNTDGLVSVGGGIINFFTSSRDWKVLNSTSPRTRTYDEFLQIGKSPNTITGALPLTSGSYLYNSGLTLSNQTVPNNYGSAVFNQLIFVNGDLTIAKDVQVNSASTALFIVKGDVLIDSGAENIDLGIIAEGDMFTAYNRTEVQTSKTLNFKGIFSANKIVFQRTLQGTNNNDTPSEDFTFEPKYLIQQKDFFSKSAVRWLKSE